MVNMELIFNRQKIQMCNIKVLDRIIFITQYLACNRTKAIRRVLYLYPPSTSFTFYAAEL